MQSILEQARFELDELIRKLLQLEPYWKKCSNCKNKGKCCIGANILVFDVEWDQIKEFIKSMPESDKEKIKSNIKNKKACFFRGDQKCIIHGVRPLNCRWVPYVAYLGDSQIRYFEESNCSFRELMVTHTFSEKYPNYVLLPHPSDCTSKYHLLLENWKQRWLPLSDAHHMSDLVNDPEFLNLLNYS